jgi:cysteine desulfurase / selenocysteine lyase
MDVRKDFPFLKRGIIYFDSAATSQKPRQVIDAVKDFYENHTANIHRGIHVLSEEATELYEESKKKVAEFLGVPSWREVVYVKNATEGLNMAVAMSRVSRGDKLVSTVMEHHSSFLPLMKLKSEGARLEFVGLKDGELDMEDFHSKIKGAKLLTVSHASNVLGTINPLKEIVSTAREEGATVIVDAAQSAPHLKVDFKKIGADFLAFSGHKMLAPSGTGGLCVRRELVEDALPPMAGGGTIEDVTLEEVRWAGIPERFEAGTPNLEGAVGLGAAVDYLSKLGMNNVRKHELKLLKRFFTLSEDTPMRIYGPPAGKRTGLAAFTVPGIHAHDVADFLNARKIAVRSGKHCAHQLHHYLGLRATTRASFYVYNTVDEIEKFFEAFKELLGAFA